VLPVFVVVVLFFALLISYPWQVLSLGALGYLACLPLGWLSYRNYVRKDAEAAAALAVPVSGENPSEQRPPELRGEDERPARLN